jgi:hypothetical protein
MAIEALSKRGDECLRYGHPLSFDPLLGRHTTPAQRALETARLVDAFERRSSARLPALSPDHGV